VRIEDSGLQGTLWGEPVDVARHLPACEPKGATYTALHVERRADGTWTAGCVVDV
jgi:SHS2 domain-containing protein